MYDGRITKLDTEELGARIRVAREHRGWSQRKLGDEVHATIGTIHRIEEALINPPMWLTDNIRHILDIH